MRIVVIGGNGFIGSNIVRYFHRNGHNVVSCDSRAPKYECEGVKYHLIDKESIDEYAHVFQKDDYVILLRWHGVAATSPKDQILSTKFNIVDTMNIMSYCAEAKVGTIAFASSGGTVYGIPEYTPIDENHITRPLSLYGNQKLMIENYMLMFSGLYGIKTYVLRISNPYGPGQEPFRGQGVVATFLASALLDRSIEVWGSGQEIRDYVYIDDLSECFEKLLSYSGKESIFNLGSGVGSKLNHIIDSVELATSKHIIRNSMQERECQVKSNVLDCSRAKSILNWQAGTSLDKGIEKMCQSWNSNTNKFEII